MLRQGCSPLHLTSACGRAATVAAVSRGAAIPHPVSDHWFARPRQRRMGRRTLCVGWKDRLRQQSSSRQPQLGERLTARIARLAHLLLTKQNSYQRRLHPVSRCRFRHPGMVRLIEVFNEEGPDGAGNVGRATYFVNELFPGKLPPAEAYLPPDGVDGLVMAPPFSLRQEPSLWIAPTSAAAEWFRVRNGYGPSPSPCWR
eukprot:scaffold165747_cov27-Tisochrysis_lutea.AAC.3